MIRKSLRYGLSPAALLLAALLTVAAPAPADEGARLATVSISSAGVEFRPEVEFDRAILTVAGGGEVRRIEFAPGEAPSFDILGPQGETLADGSYQWELELLPTQEERRKLMIATTRNGGRTPGAREPQTGSFAIAGGYLVDPRTTERAEERPSGESGSASFGARAPSDLSAGLDADSGVCAGLSKMRSARCEAEALGIVQGLAAATVDPFSTMAPVRQGLGDSDAEVATGQAAELMFVPSPREGEATQPLRTHDPEGANGRPRSEEDPR